MRLTYFEIQAPQPLTFLFGYSVHNTLCARLPWLPDYRVLRAVRTEAEQTLSRCRLGLKKQLSTEHQCSHCYDRAWFVSDVRENNFGMGRYMRHTWLICIVTDRLKITAYNIRYLLPPVRCNAVARKFVHIFVLVSDHNCSLYKNIE